MRVNPLALEKCRMCTIRKYPPIGFIFCNDLKNDPKFIIQIIFVENAIRFTSYKALTLLNNSALSHKKIMLNYTLPISKPESFKCVSECWNDASLPLALSSYSDDVAFVVLKYDK